MQRTLLIKTGAAGDVVRTTVLLNILPGAVTWVTDKKYCTLLPGRHPALEKIMPLEDALSALQHEQFDLTISLEEDDVCASLASSINSKKLVGIYKEGDIISYTNDAAGWFDMSLLSKKGSTVANELKLENTDTFQYWLFKMMGLDFSGEPYCIYNNKDIKKEKGLIGIETRAGARWPNKSWSGYSELIQKLNQAGYDCLVLTQKQNITEYLEEIARCSFLISGDTLAMHVAMAYQIPSIALFNCTSPSEIYDYGTCKKIVSPLLKKSFYSREFSREVVDSISPESVFNAFIQQTQFNERPAKV